MQNRPKNQTEPADFELFRSAVGEVKPLPAQNRVTPHPMPREPVIRAPVAPSEIPDSLSDFAAGDAPDEFLRNGLSRMTLRKLRRGNWPIQDSVDLHGSHTDAARRLLQEFLHGASRRGLRCVLVIHGKGLNSKGGEAVLRKLARHWLAQRPEVLAFCNATPKDGGGGAALVLLKADLHDA